MVRVAPGDLPLKEPGGSAGFCGLRRLQIEDMTPTMTAMTSSGKRLQRALEKRPSLSFPPCDAYRAFRQKREGPLLSGTALPLSRPRKLAGALRFLPSERYARNSFARTITQASSITRNVRQ